MNARRLLWWSEASLARASVLAEGVWHRWCADWDVEANFVSTGNACEIAAESIALQWQAWTPHLRIAFGQHDPVRSMHALLFGEPGDLQAETGTVRTLSAEVADAAWGDLKDALGSVFKHPDASPPGTSQAEPRGARAAFDCRNWSGSIRIRLEATAPERVAIDVSISGALAQVLVDAAHGLPSTARCPIVPLAEALQDTQLRLPVELRELEMDLGTLRSLAKGDVIALPHRLNEPLQVRLRSNGADRAGSSVLCEAALGARNGHRAIELLRAAAGA